jgi:Fe-S cluster assembly iron-binding protein IscA
MLKVTQPASVQLRAVLMQQEKEDLFIRIFLKGLG